MDYKYINQLLDRYWRGETTLEEESILRSFFSQDDVPEDIKQYKPFFCYQRTEPAEDSLGEEFNERMLSMIEEPKVVKAHTISMHQRLMPLLKAAAVVAIILTIGGAVQKPFNQQSTTQMGNVTGYDYNRIQHGTSVASADSSIIDSLHHSSVNMNDVPVVDQ